MTSILTPLQSDWLDEFFVATSAAKFFLTGGTALAEYYFQHRLSDDIDLFTTSDEAFELARRETVEVARRLNCALTDRVAAPAFQQFILTRVDETLRVDLVRDIDIQFGAHLQRGRVIVDSLENIGANKITAIFGRTAAKDFVDFYFILQAGHTFDDLLRLTKEKDTGLTEFFLAGMMRQVVKLDRLPRMLKDVSLDKLKEFYLSLADDLLRNIRPDSR